MGFWLLLQNCHLSLSFCEEIMQTVIDSEEIHANFRLVAKYLIRILKLFETFFLLSQCNK